MIEKFAKSKIFYEKWEAEKCNALAKVKPPLLIFEYESALQTHTIHPCICCKHFILPGSKRFSIPLSNKE